MKAIILAGGFATRLWPLTENVAKPLLIVGDKPLISHIVDEIPEMPIIISTNEVFAEDFRTWHKQYHPARDITVLVEPTSRDKQLGALGAIAYAIAQFGEDEYLISAGDNIYSFPIREFLDSYKGNLLVAAYDIGDLEKAKKFGVIKMDEESGRATEFLEKPANPTSTLVSTALYVIPKTALVFLAEVAQKTPENMGSLLESAIGQGIVVDVFRFSGAWFDIGNFDTYIEVHKKFGKANTQLAGNQLEGAFYIDPTATVTDSTIVNSIVLGGSKLHHVHLNRVIVGQGCVLENIDLEYKTVRDNTRLIGDL